MPRTLKRNAAEFVSTRLVSAQTLACHSLPILVSTDVMHTVPSGVAHFRYFWHLGPLRAGPPSAPFRTYDMTSGSDVACQLYPGWAKRRRISGNARPIKIREEIPLRLLQGLLRYSTLGSCNPGSLMCPPSRPPLPNSALLVRIGMGDTAFSSGYTKKRTLLELTGSVAKITKESQ